MLLLLTTTTTMFAAESSPIPKHFSAYIGGFLGASYQVELHDGVITYTTFGPGHSNPNQTNVIPTATEWSEFRKTLNDLNIWRWHGEYSNNNTQDGTQWSFDIAFADRAIKSHGNNSYPDDAGNPNDTQYTTKTFKCYLDAIKKLIGGKDFE